MSHHFCGHVLKYIALLAEFFPSDKEKKAASCVCVCVCIYMYATLCFCPV